MKKRKTIYIAALCLLLCLLSAGCKETPGFFQTEPMQRDENAIIREMVNFYRKDGPLAVSDVNRCIEELKSTDAALADRWQRIMDYWEYANEEMVINTGAIPADLKDPAKLCIIVLGFQLNPDGSMQPELLGRLERALECARVYPGAYVLCTGGPTASSDRSKSEAGEMAAWLAAQGVPTEKLLVEDRSMTTTQNASYSWTLLHERCPDVDSVILVSSNYHIPWGAVLLETQFILMEDQQRLHVVSNVAYIPPNAPNYSVRSTQASGILDLAGIRR